MPRAMLVTSGKGGTGKSTVSQLVARALCGQNKNVLLLELDSGLRGLDLMLGVTDRVVYDLSDLLCGRCRPAKAIVQAPTARGNLHLIAAPLDRFFVPDRANLVRLLSGLSGCYDFLLFDTAAGFGRSFDVAASVCDGALLVTHCDPVAVRDAAKAAGMLRRLSPRLVLNCFSRRQLGEDFPTVDAVIDAVGARLISVVPDDPAIPRACACGRTPPPDSPAMQEIFDLSRRLSGERILLNTQRLK